MKQNYAQALSKIADESNFNSYLCNRFSNEKKMGTIVIKDMSNQAYHNTEGLSRSAITALQVCPKYYYEKYIGGYGMVRNETPQMQLGSLVHTLVLESDKFADRYFVLHEYGRKTKKIKQKIEEDIISNPGKTLITTEMYEKAISMASSLMTNIVFSRIYGMYDACIEDSFFYKKNDLDVIFKSRPDYYNIDFILDIKTAKCAQKNAFSKSIFNFGLHIQAAMALDALNSLNVREYQDFIFLVVESEPPYLTATYMLEPDAIEYGRQIYLDVAKTYIKCRDSNYWPSYNDEIERIDIPGWAKLND